VERIAVGGGDDELAEGVGELVHLLQDLAYELPALPSRERPYVEPIVEVEPLPPVRVAFQQRRPGRGEEEHGAVVEDVVRGVDPGERAVVGPVEVLDEHHHRRLLGQIGEPLGEAGHGPIAQTPRIVTRGWAHLAPAEVEAEPPGDVMGPARPPFGRTVQALEAPLPLLPDDIRAVALLDVQAVGHDVPPQGVRTVLVRRSRPALEPPDPLGQLGDPPVELGEQPGLAHPRVAEDRDHPPLPVIDDVLVEVLKPAQFDVAADRSRVDSLHTA
jgi:hypothetical protein